MPRITEGPVQFLLKQSLHGLRSFFFMDCRLWAAFFWKISHHSSAIEEYGQVERKFSTFTLIAAETPFAHFPFAFPLIAI